MTSDQCFFQFLDVSSSLQLIRRRYQTADFTRLRQGRGRGCGGAIQRWLLFSCRRRRRFRGTVQLVHFCVMVVVVESFIFRLFSFLMNVNLKFQVPSLKRVLLLPKLSSEHQFAFNFRVKFISTPKICQ